MDDITRQLRESCFCEGRGCELCRAADEIDRLRAELAACREEASRYLKALYNIIDAWDGNDDSMGSDPAEIARAALSPARKGEGEGR